MGKTSHGKHKIGSSPREKQPYLNGNHTGKKPSKLIRFDRDPFTSIKMIGVNKCISSFIGEMRWIMDVRMWGLKRECICFTPKKQPQPEVANASKLPILKRRSCLRTNRQPFPILEGRLRQHWEQGLLTWALGCGGDLIFGKMLLLQLHNPELQPFHPLSQTEYLFLYIHRQAVLDGSDWESRHYSLV